MFILDSDGRDHGSFVRYRAYLDEHQDSFPPNALALARSDWYFGFTDPRAPHDGHLERLELTERPRSDDSPWQDRVVSLRVTLRSSYDSGFIVLEYAIVHGYRLDAFGLVPGHADWRFDELRLDDDGRLVHEVEWCRSADTARWLVVANDLTLEWRPDPN